MDVQWSRVCVVGGLDDVVGGKTEWNFFKHHSTVSSFVARTAYIRTCAAVLPRSHVRRPYGIDRVLDRTGLERTRILLELEILNLHLDDPLHQLGGPV